MHRRPIVMSFALALFAFAPLPAAWAQNAAVTLQWTAPGDDGNTGTATQYEVRVSTSPITSGNFAAATLVPNPPAPQAAGTSQSMLVGGLQAATNYWIAIRTADERGNWSVISNVVAFTTSAGDTVRPAAPALATSGTGASSVTLAWVATGDDSLAGVAHHYEIRWSTAPITPANFAAATLVTSGVPTPAAPGANQSCTVTGLNRNVDLWFAMRVVDENANASALSNVVLVDHLLDTAPPATPAGLAASLQPGGVRLQWTPNSEADLAGLPSDVGHQVFWAGPQSDTQLEFSSDETGNVHLRYLTGDAEAGDPNQSFLNIGSYPFAGAYEATRKLANGPNVVKITEHGGVGFYDPANPYSVIIAWPSQPDLQVEVYDPEKNRSLEFVRSGDIVPVS